MAEPKAESPPAWKYRELAGAKAAALDHYRSQDAALEKVISQERAAQAAYVAREDWSIRNARYWGHLPDCSKLHAKPPRAGT